MLGRGRDDRQVEPRWMGVAKESWVWHPEPAFIASDSLKSINHLFPQGHGNILKRAERIFWLPVSVLLGPFDSASSGGYPPRGASSTMAGKSLVCS